MNKIQLLNYICIATWAITFLGAGLYLGWRLLDFNVGDCVLFCFFIASLLYIGIIREK